MALKVMMLAGLMAVAAIATMAGCTRTTSASSLIEEVRFAIDSALEEADSNRRFRLSERRYRDRLAVVLDADKLQALQPRRIVPGRIAGRQPSVSIQIDCGDDPNEPRRLIIATPAY